MTNLINKIVFGIGLISGLGITIMNYRTYDLEINSLMNVPEGYRARMAEEAIKNYNELSAFEKFKGANFGAYLAAKEIKEKYKSDTKK